MARGEAVAGSEVHRGRVGFPDCGCTATLALAWARAVYVVAPSCPVVSCRWACDVAVARQTADTAVNENWVPTDSALRSAGVEEGDATEHGVRHDAPRRRRHRRVHRSHRPRRHTPCLSFCSPHRPSCTKPIGYYLWFALFCPGAPTETLTLPKLS